MISIATPGNDASAAVGLLNDVDRQLMLELAISFERGRFSSAGFHYDRLSDAVRYARYRRQLSATSL